MIYSTWKQKGDIVLICIVVRNDPLPIITDLIDVFYQSWSRMFCWQSEFLSCKNGIWVSIYRICRIFCVSSVEVIFFNEILFYTDPMVPQVFHCIALPSDRNIFGNWKRCLCPPSRFNKMSLLQLEIRFELTTLVVIGTDCTGSCKSNYHRITTTAAPFTIN
jgi:hypothetical protein